MDNEKRLVFEVLKLNTSDRDVLRRLEINGIIKQVRVCKDGSLDMRTVKKEVK